MRYPSSFWCLLAHCFFFFNDTATTEIYTLSLHDALPICHLSEKLPVSRWQRDLSDSTAQRNLGAALGHTLLAYASCLRGLGKLQADPRRLAADLEANWEVLTEAVQQVMRRHGVPDAYDKLKAISRGRRLDRRALAAFIRKLPIPAEARKPLLALTPAKYTGLAQGLATKV